MCSNLLLTGLAALALNVVLVVARSELIQSENQLQASPLKGCIDDSDCKNLEGKYACFQYVCYPYENDSFLSPENKLTQCTKKEECQLGEVCHRHHEVRRVQFGRCMAQNGDCTKADDCKGQGGSQKCCNGQFCCEDKYFNQLKTLPCLNHFMCQDLGYGKFCCPQKSGNSNTTASSICCDINPNPPSTPAPVRGNTNAASPLVTLGYFRAFSLVAAFLPAFIW